MPKVSIIMPVYNKQDYLKRSLNSVLNQDFSDYELIVIDDGSTDDSLQILEEYQKKDGRIRVFHTDNHGVSHARNVGLENCTGKYLTFVDGDDEIFPNYLSSLYDDINTQNVDMVIQGMIKFGRSGRKIQIVPPLEGRYTVDEIIESFAEIQENTGIYGYCVSKMFPASLTKGLEFDTSIRLAEDFDFYLKLYRKIKTIYLNQSTNYLYYSDIIGSSMDMNDEDIDYYSQMLINIRFKELLEEKNAYCETNKKLVDQKISRYAFLTLFYSPVDRFESYFSNVVRLAKAYGIDIYTGKKIQKQVLSAVKKNDCERCKSAIKRYKLIRNIVRRARRIGH